MEGINPKSKAVWRERFFGVNLRRLERFFAQYRSKAGGCLELLFFRSSHWAAWGASRSVWKGSRRLSGRNVFSGYISGRWRDFLQRIDQKPKAVWREYFFGVHFRRLVGLFAGYRPKAEGCLELHFFGSSQRAAGEIFRKGLTQSRRQPGAVLFRVIAAGRLGSLAVGVERQLKAAWHEHLFRVHLRALEMFFAEYRPKAEGCLELYFFGLSQRAAGEIFRKGLTKSRRLSGGNIFSGYRNGPFGEPRDRWEKAAGGCLAETSFRGKSPKAGEVFCSV